MELIERLTNWFRGIPQSPFRLMISVTSRCNLHCKFCDKWRTKRKERLKKDHVIRLIREAKKFGIREIHFSGGGEPFLRKRILLEAMKKVKEYGMKGMVVTNGTLLERKDLEKLIHLKWDTINFSLDSCKAEVHDYFRGKGTFRKTVKAIQLLKSLKNIHKSFFPIISISTIINKENFVDLDKFVLFAKNLGCSSIRFQYVRNITDEASEIEVDFHEIRPYVKSAVELAQKFNMDTNLKDFIFFKNVKSLEDIGKLLLSLKSEEFPFSIPCYAPWYIIMVNEEGKVGPCPVLASKSNIDIFSFSLGELWYGEYFSSFRKKMIQKNVDGCICGAPTVSENKCLREELKKFWSQYKDNKLTRI